MSWEKSWLIYAWERLWIWIKAWVQLRLWKNTFHSMRQPPPMLLVVTICLSEVSRLPMRVDIECWKLMEREMILCAVCKVPPASSLKILWWDYWRYTWNDAAACCCVHCWVRDKHFRICMCTSDFTLWWHVEKCAEKNEHVIIFQRERHY